ncbi:MAG: acyltransferase family protein [Acinetobacter sp.]
MQKRNDIQILRALAVIFVVLFHLEVGGIESGFLGVDVFFVVSGFLMAILYKTGETKKFFERRAKRLLPAYFTTVVITLIASIFIVLPSELGQVATQSIYSLFFANNFGFWMQNSYFSKTDFNPLLHLWSLGVEIQFYLIVPILVWFFRKSKIFLPIILIGSFLSCVFVVGISPKTSFFIMPLRIWEFLIGFIVAYYLTNNGNIKTQKYQWLGLSGLIILCAIPFINVDGQSLNRLEAHPSFYALLVCLSTSLVLSFGLPKILEDSIFGQFLAKIGDYSYSIYLVHFPIIVLYLYKPFSGTILYPESYKDKTILLILIIFFSVLIHRLIEIRKFHSISKVYITSLISLSLLVGCTKVVPYIYNQESQNIFNALSDRATFRCGKYRKFTHPNEISCKINNENFEQSILLIGDSHTDSIKVSFAEVASMNKYNTYLNFSNEVFTDESITPEMLINEAKKLKIEKIVMHFSAKRFNPKMIHKIEKLAKIAKENNININIILPIPFYNESVPKIVYEEKVLSKYDKNTYLDNNKDILKKIKEIEYIKAFDVYQVFCQPNCLIANNNYYPLYFDSNHLNLTGAKKLIPIFKRVIENQ